MRKALSAILVLLLLGAVFIAVSPALGLFNSCSSPSKSITAEQPTVEPVSAEDLANLTVRKLTTEELERLTIEKFHDVSWVLLDSSLTSKDRERTAEAGFSDALTFGFKSEDKLGELETEILRNPVVAITYVKAIKDKKIGSQTVGDLNSWMGEMAELADANGLVYWLERRGDDKVIYVTEEFRRYAATLCVWIERLAEVGDQTWSTAENWALNCTTENNARRGIVASYQYTGEFYTLAYVGKNGSSLLTIGFNTKDKRPATPAVPVNPNLTPKPTATPVAGTPVPTSQPTPTPTGTAVPKPTPTPTPTGTAVPKPTPTPRPTNTPTPPPTGTAVPKPTPTPTPTPRPTNTPRPTPSPTPKPTKDPSQAPSHPPFGTPNPGGPGTFEPEPTPTPRPTSTPRPSNTPAQPTPPPTPTAPPIWVQPSTAPGQPTSPPVTLNPAPGDDFPDP